MILRLVVALLSLLVIAESALVQSYECTDVKQSDFSMEPLFTEAFYEENQELLSFRVITNITDYITDVNSTTNMYTTLHVRIEFTGGEILDKYLRLCDYVSVVNRDDIPIPFFNTSLTYNSSTLTSSLATVSSAAYSSSTTQAVIADEFSTMSQYPQDTTSTTASDTATLGAAAATTSDSGSAMIQQVNAKREEKFELLVREDASDQDGTNICPLYANEVVEINYNISIGKYHKFGSYDLRFTVISADSSQKVIGCNRFYVTPQLPEAATKGVGISVAVLAGWMVLVSIFTLIFSPYQESQNPFLLFCSTICNAPLLNQLSPAFDDFIVYLHFAFFMAGLDVQYPGFYQPLLSSIRWIVLLSTSFQRGRASPVMDNIYITFGSSPLGYLTSFSTSDFEADAWINFMWLFASIIGGLLAVTFAATLVLWLRNRDNVDYQGFKSKIFLHSLGLINRMFFFVFATPFVVLSIYLWTATGSPEFKKWTLGLSIVFFACWVAAASFFIVKYIFIAKNRARLYSSLKVILLWSALYHKYDPSKVYYFIIECLELLIFSIVVGAMRYEGTAQVAIIIVIQSFSLICLIFIKPYYLKTKLNSSKMTIAIAKLCTSILTVPYIRSLNISEKNRSYVAYAEAFLHLFVIFFIFFVPSLYCAILTIISIYRYKRGELSFDEKSEADVPLSHKNSYHTLPQTRANSMVSELFTNDYSYYRQPHQPKYKPSWPPELQRAGSIMSRSTSKLEITDQRVLPLLGMTTNSPDSENDSYSRNVDYSVREVDKFYNASRILEPDPEVKRIWEAREERRNGIMSDPEDEARTASPQRPSFQYIHAQQSHPTVKNSQKKMNWLFQKKKKKEVETKGFEVDRPRPLVVKRMSMLVNDDTTTTDIGSSIIQKDFDEEDFTSETATRASYKPYEDDIEDDNEISEKSLDDDSNYEKLVKKMHDDIITEESDEDDHPRSQSESDFFSFEEGGSVGK